MDCSQWVLRRMMVRGVTIFALAAASLPRSSIGFVARPPRLPMFATRTRSTASGHLFYFQSDFPSDADALSMNIYELERARTEFEHLLSNEFKNSHQHSAVQPAGPILRWNDVRGDSSSVEGERRIAPSSIRDSTSSIGSSAPLGAVASIDDEDVEPCMMLLTNAGRRFRELELTLLERLRDSDDAVDELIHLWTTERDEVAAKALLSLQSGRYECSDGLVAEEAALTALCRTYPGWAEPWSRLAMLLFYKGRISDSLSAAEEAASVKPWHFEALNVGVLIVNQANDSPTASTTREDADPMHMLLVRAVSLARQTLPPLSPKDDHRARRAWVDRAVSLATQQLKCAEAAHANATLDWSRKSRLKQQSKTTADSVPQPPVPEPKPEWEVWQ